MTDLSAAIGLVELARYENDMLVKRKHICDSYTAFFKTKPWAKTPVQKTENAETSYHLYPLRINNITETQRDKIMQHIFDKDVSVNVHFIPLPMLTFYKKIGFNITDYPVTYKTFSCEISLPVFYDLTDDQINIVCDAVNLSVEEVINTNVTSK